MYTPRLECARMKKEVAACSEIVGGRPPVGERFPSGRLALLVFAALTAVFAVSILYRPPDGDYFTICGFKNLTGLPCPGCGLTHSFCALGKGEVWRALSYNLLGPPVFLFSILVWVRSSCVLLGWGKHALACDRLASRVKFLNAFMIAFMLFGVLRILYLLVYRPVVWHNSPLSKLVSWITG